MSLLIDNLFRKRNRNFFVTLALIFCGVVVAWISVLIFKNSYIFTIRADGTCGVRVHSINISPRSAIVYVQKNPASGTTEENAVKPNTITFYVVRLLPISHPSISLSAINRTSPTVVLTIDDEFLDRSKATGGIAEISVTADALQCELTNSNN